MPIELLEVDPFDRRRYCECCGCPTLGVPDGYAATPEWALARNVCDLCEWESPPVTDDGDVNTSGDTAEMRNDGLSLDRARDNFEHFLSIYDPADPPQWRVSEPSVDIRRSRTLLRSAFAALPHGAGPSAFEQWFRIRELERQLASALRSQRDRDMEIDDIES